MEKTQRWLTQATAKIRFGPDRAAVQAELQAHLEDSAAALRQAFPQMTASEAEMRAIERMGDPAQLSDQLARLHRPYLGWLWRMSQIALALVAAALVITCFCLGDDMLLGDGYNAVLWSQPTLRVEEADILWQTDGEWEWEQGGQHLKTTFAALVQYEERTELQLGLQLTTWRFWETGRLQAEKLYIVDSLGNEYPGEWDMLLADGLGPFHGSYRIVLDYIPLEARWVEVSYGADVFSFRLELPRQEGHVR